ncbi:hypothetical protein N0V90_007684 [Kalmusia sp. IMI 367209]|nr:hypothetical protein N0V90_007684 [Kalmusia sp. IMI 367209]
MLENKAAWILEAKAKLTVKEAPMPRAGKGEVVVRNHAVAINPIEWKIQQYGVMVKTYPNILGCDTAGVVHEVGEGVTHVDKGDRVLAHHYSLLTNSPSNGAFQLYSLTTALLVQKIPDSLSYTHATVLPLALSTAANSLFNKKTLGLPYPSTNPPGPTGKSVLIWGGSSSVGACAVQFAVAAGVKVVSVASAHNVSKVKDLGAHSVFDYHLSSVTENILGALEGTEYLGVADCISTKESTAGWTPIFKALGGRYASVQPDVPGIPDGAEGETVWAPMVAFADREVGEATWGRWVAEALENGVLKAKPDPVVVGKGLERVQEAMDRQRQGVSFAKVVVEL